MGISNKKQGPDHIGHIKTSAGIPGPTGPPGEGFKKTSDGNYDIQNKKLRNVATLQGNNDASTKSYVDNEVSKTLKLDGSNSMTGVLNMDNRRVENIAPARHGFSDAVSSLHLHSFYLNINTDDGKIEVQNPIDMKNEKNSNLGEGTDNSDAITKHQLETALVPKADKTELNDYLKRDGSISLTGDFDFGDNKITKVGNGTQSTDVVNKGYVDTELFAKPNINQVVLRDGSQDMTGNLNMSLNKIINCGQPTGTRDVTNKAYVDFEVGKKPDINQVVLRDGSNTILNDLDMTQKRITNIGPPSSSFDAARKSYVDNQFSRCLRLDGSNKMTSNLDMNNLQIKNVKDATNNQDAITLKQVNDAVSTIITNSEKYTDQKISESHISTHQNRKNVLAYAMEDADEFTTDFGLQGAQKVTYSDSPHLNNKSAIAFKVRKTTDGSNLFKGRLDFNLYTLTEKNFSNQYTICLEIIFPKDRRYDKEFNSTKLTFEKLNINIDKFHTIKINNDYNYYRTILNLSPDGSSKLIQRRLYTTIECSYDNLSPNLLQLYAIIYGIKGEAKNDLDLTIYDYEKAYEFVNNQFQMHVPINMNGNDILKTTHYLHGDLNTNAQDKTFTINGSKKILIPSGSIIKQIQILYNSFKFNNKTLNIEIYYGPGLTLSDFFTSSQTTQIQTFNTNMTIQNGHFRVKLINKDVPNEELNILIKYIH